MFVASQTSEIFVMEIHGALFVKQNHTLVALVIVFFLHSLQRACFPADTQICTDPENLILSTAFGWILVYMIYLVLSQVKCALFLFGTEGDSWSHKSRCVVSKQQQRTYLKSLQINTTTTFCYAVGVGTH